MNNKEMRYQIRKAQEEDWYGAMELAWKTFMKFEACDYSQAGIKSFQEFVTDKMLHRMFVQGVYPLYLAMEDTRIIGLISLRNDSHISLLFVDEQYHKLGIGKSLIHHIAGVAREEQVQKFTVNSSPYGIGFYHKIGFKDSDVETEKDGIRYTPMILELQHI